MKKRKHRHTVPEWDHASDVARQIQDILRPHDFATISLVMVLLQTWFAGQAEVQMEAGRIAQESPEWAIRFLRHHLTHVEELLRAMHPHPSHSM